MGRRSWKWVSNCLSSSSPQSIIQLSAGMCFWLSSWFSSSLCPNETGSKWSCILVQMLSMYWVDEFWNSIQRIFLSVSGKSLYLSWWCLCRQMQVLDHISTCTVSVSQWWTLQEKLCLICSLSGRWCGVCWQWPVHLSGRLLSIETDFIFCSMPLASGESLDNARESKVVWRAG